MHGSDCRMRIAKKTRISEIYLNSPGCEKLQNLD